MVNAIFLRKIIPIITTFVLVPAPAIADDFKVVMLLPSPISDHGFNQAGLGR